MAHHLASIYGTEKDRVNCPFYFKVRIFTTSSPAFPSRSRTPLPAPASPPRRRSRSPFPPQFFPPPPSQIGACRHGDRCSRLHMRPTLSQTILMPNFYLNPAYATGGNPNMTPRELEEHFEDFYEDIFDELAKHGEIEGLNVCDNLADHLVGNVYVKFREEEAALSALNAMNGRYYQGRPIRCEFSPVTDFPRIHLPPVRGPVLQPRGLLQLHAPSTDRPTPPKTTLRSIQAQAARRRSRQAWARRPRTRSFAAGPEAFEVEVEGGWGQSRRGRGTDHREGYERRGTKGDVRAMERGGEGGDADAGAPQPAKEDGEAR